MTELLLCACLVGGLVVLWTWWRNHRRGRFVESWMWLTWPTFNREFAWRVGVSRWGGQLWGTPRLKTGIRPGECPRFERRPGYWSVRLPFTLYNLCGDRRSREHIARHAEAQRQFYGEG